METRSTHGNPCESFLAKQQILHLPQVLKIKETEAAANKINVIKGVNNPISATSLGNTLTQAQVQKHWYKRTAPLVACTYCQDSLQKQYTEKNKTNQQPTKLTKQNPTTSHTRTPPKKRERCCIEHPLRSSIFFPYRIARATESGNQVKVWWLQTALYSSYSWDSAHCSEPAYQTVRESVNLLWVQTRQELLHDTDWPALGLHPHDSHLETMCHTNVLTAAVAWGIKYTANSTSSWCCTPLGWVKATSVEASALLKTEMKLNGKLLKAVPWIHLQWPCGSTAQTTRQQQCCAPKKNLLDWEHQVHHLCLSAGCHHLPTLIWCFL